MISRKPLAKLSNDVLTLSGDYFAFKEMTAWCNMVGWGGPMLPKPTIWPADEPVEVVQTVASFFSGSSPTNDQEQLVAALAAFLARFGPEGSE